MADATSGSCEKFTITEVHAAIKKMKNNKAAGPSGVISDMIKAAGETGTIWIMDLCNSIVREEKIPKDTSRYDDG